jgi:hypothetical protein
MTFSRYCKRYSKNTALPSASLNDSAKEEYDALNQNIETELLPKSKKIQADTNTIPFD